MGTIRISTDYHLKWQIKDLPHIQISTCKKIINTKTGRQLKETINCYTKGFWIGRKFIPTNKINNHIEKIEKQYCPF